MRSLAHWYRRPGILSALLAPLGSLYAAGTARKLAGGARLRVDVPVICVGNLTAGGTGKTPTVIALAERLQARGLAVHAVSRGYGGSDSGPLRVEPARHTSQEVGDEPLLMSSFLPVWVARDRAAGASAAAEAGAEVILLDDGFQNASLAHDLSIVVVDAARGFGNGRVIPAGPLREPVRRGLSRADLLLSIGDETAQARFSEDWGEAVRVPMLRGQLLPLVTGLPMTGLRVLAFAGIGDPEKFFSTLRTMGAEVVRTEPLADHQLLSEQLLGRLSREAQSLGANLVTTEKDAVRLPSRFRRRIMTVPVRLNLADAAPLEAALDRLLGPQTSRPA